MTLGQKLRQARVQAGFTQEELADKLCVSRQAVTKWESDRGTPDIANLQSIARLFDVNMDSLLATGWDGPTGEVVRQSIDLSQFHRGGRARSASDAAVLATYPQATAIRPLVRRKRLRWFEVVLEIITQAGIFQVADSLRDLSAWYLVSLEQRRLLVNVTDSFIESRELSGGFPGPRIVVGDRIFWKATYSL
ncbi:MAG: helix-turn-helix domain-containing protein [Propionibacteriaceae bacterium]|nr:helix-turn-helix domain-containing protein [Propionibacteriaceae bacterium]